MLTPKNAALSSSNRPGAAMRLRPRIYPAHLQWQRNTIRHSARPWRRKQTPYGYLPGRKTTGPDRPGGGSCTAALPGTLSVKATKLTRTQASNSPSKWRRVNVRQSGDWSERCPTFAIRRRPVARRFASRRSAAIPLGVTSPTLEAATNEPEPRYRRHDARGFGAGCSRCPGGARYHAGDGARANRRPRRLVPDLDLAVQCRRLRGIEQEAHAVHRGRAEARPGRDEPLSRAGVAQHGPIASSSRAAGVRCHPSRQYCGSRSLLSHRFQPSQSGTGHMLGRRERQVGLGHGPLSPQFVPERRLLCEHDRKNRKHLLSGSPAGREHVGLSGDRVRAVDATTGLLSARIRWDADLSKLAVSRGRAESLRNPAGQHKLQFSAQMGIEPVSSFFPGAG